MASQSLKISFPLQVAFLSSKNNCLIIHIAIIVNTQDMVILKNIKEYVLEQHDQTFHHLSVTEVAQLIYDQLIKSLRTYRKLLSLPNVIN